METMKRWICILSGLGALWLATAGLYALVTFLGHAHFSRATFREPLQMRVQPEIGQVLDSWRGVPVRYNGTPYWRSIGKHSAESGYYYGKQWQCVEFIKRFYYDALGHEMPEVMGHAESFFDPELPHAALNPDRNLIQYQNGGREPPQLDDLIVWQQDIYGHVAIVSKVMPDEIEVVQQNVIAGTRQRLKLHKNLQGNYRVGPESGQPAGWLRQPADPRAHDDGTTPVL
ncbi:MAG: CHAP domain-containing protein [Verrucomicrobiota bacterium]